MLPSKRGNKIKWLLITIDKADKSQYSYNTKKNGY